MRQDRHAIPLSQRFGRARVIGMRMSQQDGLDAPADLDQVIDLPFEVGGFGGVSRARIDDVDAPLPR